MSPQESRARSVAKQIYDYARPKTITAFEKERRALSVEYTIRFSSREARDAVFDFVSGLNQQHIRENPPSFTMIERCRAKTLVVGVKTMVPTNYETIDDPREREKHPGHPANY